MSKYHLIGIKGAGMSSLACLLKDYGHYVQGSDVYEDFFTSRNLEAKNIPILPFDEANIQHDFIIIVGNAFLDNIEHQKAKELKCEIYTYYEYLGELSKKFTSIAITGSHGKTTTTNLIRQILSYDKNINYLIGDGQGAGTNQSDLFVFEACEYKRHFLYYFPKIAVITNLDFDHPDYYKDMDDIKMAFKDFINQSQTIVYNGDDEELKSIIPKDKESISFGLNCQNDYYAININNDKTNTHFDLYFKEKYLCRMSIPLFGIHSVYNALACIAATSIFIHDPNVIKQQLIKFQKGKRRFEETVINDQVVISDYAHHPKEIKATIEACMSKYPYKRIIVYFQPHTYTRTSKFMKEFSQSLSLANKVFLREIFSSARESHQTISVNDLAKLIDLSVVINDNSYIEEFKKMKDVIIIFMGAGDIDKYCNLYLESLKNNDIFEKSS